MVETTGLGDRGEREGERGGRRGGGSLPAGGGAEPGLEPRGEMTGIFSFLATPHGMRESQFPDRLNLCLLQWTCVESQLLDHQGGPNGFRRQTDRRTLKRKRGTGSDRKRRMVEGQWVWSTDSCTRQASHRDVAHGALPPPPPEPPGGLPGQAAACLS